MASIVDWASLGGEDNKKSSSGKKTKFLKFEGGKTYTIRPIGRAFEFYKFFIKSTNRSVVVEPEDVSTASALLAEEFGMEIKPQHRYALNVIDREDQQIKILEAGQQVFKQFALWAKGNNTHPGGVGGGDWFIQVEGDGLNRKYNAQCIRPAPLSAQEMERVKKEGEVYDLEAFYSGTPISQVIARAKGQNDDANSDDIPKSKQAPSSPKKQAQAPAPVAQAQGAGINDGDLW